MAVSLLPLLCAADWWDDFSNNLAADLAPVLSLFGEQATKQFLSESTSILDSVIFAMAPLGVITAVVSAIRVYGGPSLRAFIGRAQEGGGVVEAELCSSTSRDVCEMYHNGAIVRVFGRPKILEIVHDRDAVDFYNLSDDPNTPKAACGIYSFSDYFKTPSRSAAGWREEIPGSTSGQIKDSRKRDQKKSDFASIEATADGTDRESTSQSNMDQFAPNPNLSLNIGFRKASRWVLWVVVCVGCVTQASLIVFAIVVTRYLRWKKEDANPEPWGLPMMIVGTLMLSLGMFLCAYLIERSTTERYFTRRSKDTNERQRGDQVSLYVTQPGNQTIGDQTYDAFAYTNRYGEFTDYTTSWKPYDGIHSGETKQYRKIWHALKVWVTTITTILGFILQFLGLRALHSSISVVLLGAVLFMSTIRASLRTMRLKKEQNLLRNQPDQVEGHEMDWLTMYIGLGPDVSKVESGFWSVVSPSTTQPSSSIVIKEEPHVNNSSGAIASKESVLPHFVRRTAIEDGKVVVCAFRYFQTKTARQEVNLDRALRAAEANWLASVEHGTDDLQPHLPGRLFYYRSRLADITAQSSLGKSKSSVDWDQRLVPVRVQVQQLKKAIESSAEILFTYGKFKPVHEESSPFNKRTKSSLLWKEAVSFAWSIDVAVPPPIESALTGDRTPQIHVFLRRATVGDGRTSIRWEVDERSLEAALSLGVWSLISDPLTQRTDDFDLIQSAADDIPRERVIAIGASEQDIRRAKNELKHWADGLPAIVRTTKLPTELQATDLTPYRLWKNEYQDETKRQRVSSTSDTKLKSLTRIFGWPGTKLPAIVPGSRSSIDKFILTAEVVSSIPTLCAQDLYQTFLVAMAAVIDTIEGKSSFVEASHGFILTNEVVSKLMGSVVESGLGSMEDANLIIIPTLGSRSKLPAPAIFLSQAYLLAEEHRLQRRFRAAEEVLRWSYGIALEAYDTDRNLSVMEHAVLELAELYRFALRAEKIPRQTNPPQGFYSNGLEKLKDTRDHLKLAPITELINRYTEVFGTGSLPGYASKYSSESEICLYTAEKGNRVHCLWILTKIGFNGQVDIDADAKASEDGKRSILSWAAQWGWWEVARASLELGCKVDLRDEKKWTPLTYAAYYGYAEIIRLLLRYGANPEVQDEKQRTPLSYASEQAWTSAVQVLLEDGIVDANVKDQRGYTPLHCAAEGGSCKVVDLLVEKGARLDERGPFGPEDSPPIVVAWNCGNPEVADHLHNLGARFNFQESGESLWHEIIHEGQLRSVVGSILLMNREREPGFGAEARAVQLFHHIDYDLGLFSAEDIVGEQQAPGLNIIEVLEEGTTGATHDTLVRYLQGEVEATLQVVGAYPQVLTVTDVQYWENCFNLTKDLMFYLNIGLTENILEATAKCRLRGSADLFCFFLEQSKSNGPISPDLVSMAVASGNFAEDKLKHLIEVREGEVPVTSEVLEAAIGSESIIRMMDIFLELKGVESHVTSKVLEAIAKDQLVTKDCLEELCERGLGNIVTDAVLKEFVCVWYGWDDKHEKIFKMLLNRREGIIDLQDFESLANEHDRGKKALELIHAHNDGQKLLEEYVIRIPRRRFV